METLRKIVSSDKTLDAIYTRILERARTVWKRLEPDDLLQWLDNFDGEEEYRFALALADNVLYYTHEQMRHLWRKILLNKVKLHLIDALYPNLPLPRDPAWFVQYLQQKAAFVGYGRAGKSGQAMVYEFKHGHGLEGLNYLEFNQLLNAPGILKSLDWVFFLDDIIGSGQQALQSWQRREGTQSPSELSTANPNVRFGYLVLLATADGRNLVEKSTTMKVFPGVEIDDRFKCFSMRSIVYADPAERQRARGVMQGKGLLLCPAYPLGYDGMELTVAFAHNTPDDTLPVIWKSMKDGSWNPLFERSE